MGVRAIQWSAEEDAELKRLLGLNHSMSEIASSMSRQFNRTFSRSTVVGRMFRMRQRGKMAPVIVKEKVVKVSPKPRVTSTITNVSKVHEHPMYKRKPNLNYPDPNPVQRQPDRASKHNCTLDQLTEKSCRFPFGGVQDYPPYIYCGDVTFNDTSFCVAHCELCFTPNGFAITLAKTKHTRT